MNFIYRTSTNNTHGQQLKKQWHRKAGKLQAHIR